MRSKKFVTLVRNDDGTGVVLDQRNGRYYQLNATATIVLERLLDGVSSSEVVRELEARFPDVDREAIASDARRTIASFVAFRWTEAP